MKLSIHFSLAPGKTSDLPIRMRVSYAGLRLDLRTGFVCPPDKWDASMMRVKAGASNRYGERASAINRALSKMESVLGEILARYELDGSVPEPAVLKSDFELAMGRKPSKSSRAADADGTVSAVFRRFMTEYCSVESIASRTTMGYETVLSHISDFAFYGKPVDDLTSKDLSDFVVEMRNQGLENNSVAIYLTRLKSVLKWARRSGLYHGTLPEDFCPNLKSSAKKDIHYLEWEEFERILDVKLDNPNICSIRDSFCLCCATGLRVSDCERLRRSDVCLDADVPFLQIVIKKTKKPVKIELNKWSRMIIERQPVRDDGFVFAPFTLMTRNRKLTVIARAAGISGQVRELSYVGNVCTVSVVDKADAISTHWARHTFVVHALSLGISPDVIMSWTGHSSYQTMRPYIAITDKTKAEKMELFDK